MVASKNPIHKRGRYIGSSSSSSQKQPVNQETLANIVAKEDATESISKNFPLHVCYIEQEDISLIDDAWAIRRKYLAPY